MTEQVKAPSINDHLWVIRETDTKSIEIVTVLEQFKLLLQKMIDISSFENEWIQLIESMYDQISLIIEKQENFIKLWIDIGLKDEWISFSWKMDGMINLTEEDLEKIKFNTFLQSTISLKAIVSRIDSILEKLIELKSRSFNIDEYKKLKNELTFLILGDGNIYHWFNQVSEPSSKESMLSEYNADLNESMNIITRKSVWNSWMKNLGLQKNDNPNPQLLNWIIQMLESKFKIENIDFIMDFHKKIYELYIYLKKINIIKKQEEVKDTNLSQQIQSLMDEIATIITQKLPEIETLITEKTQWKI